MTPSNEIAPPEFVRKSLAALGERVSDAFVRYVMRSDVLPHVERIASHYRTDAAGVATLALPGFIADVTIGVMNRERIASDDDMPEVARMFLSGMRLRMSGVVDDVLASPNAASPAALAAALIERFLRHPELVDSASVPVAREASPDVPAK